MQLGYSPRVEIRHTSATTIGQIYVPIVNWSLAAGAIANLHAVVALQWLALNYTMLRSIWK